MYKYIENIYELTVDGGYTKHKQLDVICFRFKQRALVDTDKERSWEQTKEYTWETLPERTVVSDKCDNCCRSGAKFYQVTFVDHSQDISPVRTLRQIDCPNAIFRVRERNKILSEGEYTLKELFDKAPAYKIIAFLKEHNINMKSFTE